MITINVASPAGSGMNYALSLLRSSFPDIEFKAVGHMRSDIEEEVPTIVILRDPYLTVASGAERWIDTAGHEFFAGSEDLIPLEDTEGIKTRIGWEAERYFTFFNGIENVKHVKVLAFKDLTEDKDKFLNMFKKEFDIQEEAIETEELNLIDDVVDSGNANRVPREKSEARKIIDTLILEIYPKETWEIWKIYSELKTKLNQEG
jgi:hypothetical protein